MVPMKPIPSQSLSRRAHAMNSQCALMAPSVPNRITEKDCKNVEMHITGLTPNTGSWNEK